MLGLICCFVVGAYLGFRAGAKFTTFKGAVESAKRWIKS